MTIYLLSVEPKGYKELTLPKGKSLMECNCLRWAGESKASSWKTPQLVWLVDEFSQTSDIDADFVKFNGAIVVSVKALEGLRDHLRGQVEFLPVSADGTTRYILNVTNILDILDKGKSIYKTYSDGHVGGCEHGFLVEPDSNQLIYKAREFMGRTFVSDQFVQIVRQLGLTGALIREYTNP